MPSLSSVGTSWKAGDVLGGAVRKGSPRLPGRGAEPARSGTALRHPSQHRAQDAGLLGAAGLPPDQAAAAAQARRRRRDHRPDPRGRPRRACQAAAHRQADPRAAACRARLRRQLHVGEGLRARAAAAGAGGVRPARPPARPRPGRLRRGRRGDRRRAAQGAPVLPRPAALGRLLRQGLPGRAHRGLPRRAQRGLRLPGRGAALDPLRQHQAGGGPDPGPRRTRADPRLRRAPVALPVPRPLRPTGQGQRQGQGRGPGRLRPAQLPGPGPDRGELRRAQRAARAVLPRPAVRSAARPRRERRRAAGARPGRPTAAAAGALRRLRPPAGAGLLAVPRALRPQRLLGADRVRPPPGAGARLRRGGGDRLRGRGHRPTSALLRPGGLRLRPAALPGAPGAEDGRPRPGRAAAGLGPARGVRDAAPPARGPHGQGRQARVRPGPAVARDVPARGRARGGARGAAARRDRLRCRETPGAVPDRAPAAQAGPDGLSLPAAGHGRDHLGRSLHGPARPGRVSEAPQVLLTHHLKTLKLPTFLREHDKLARQCAAEGVAHTGYLLRLAELELLDRERRLVERRIRQARFPAVKSLDSFDFAAIPSLNKMLVLELARCAYVGRRENVIALGPSGTGKTHVALGLGLAACQKGLTVGFTTAAALVHELLEAREERRLLRLQKQLAGYRLLIVDELGYVPLSPSGAELLFEVFSQRYERGSVIVTSNLPFDEWTSMFGSERLTGALLDRLTHHVHILELNGDSYRLKVSRARR